MDIRIREGRRGDHDLIWRETMGTVWNDIPEGERQGLDSARLEAHFRPHAKQVIDSPENAVFVAEGAAGEILGYTIVGAASTMLSPVPFGFVYDIWVAPPVRRQGVASRLLERASDWCRARGYRKLKLEVAATNRGAGALYASNGFAEERIFMGMEL